MATAEERAEVRRRTNEPTLDHYTEDALDTLIEQYGLDETIRQIWLEKAARYASLVDVTEGNSRRAMSDLHKNAVQMANSLGSSSGDAAATGVAKVHKITRA